MKYNKKLYNATFYFFALELYFSERRILEYVVRICLLRKVLFFLINCKVSEDERSRKIARNERRIIGERMRVY